MGFGASTGSRLRSALSAVATALAIAVFVSPAAHGAKGDDSGATNDDGVEVRLLEAAVAAQGQPGSFQEAGVHYEWDFAYLCVDSLFRHDQEHGCPDGRLPRIEYCDDGAEATPPLWYRAELRPGSGSWSAWEMFRGYHCSPERTFDHHLRLAWENTPIAPHVITLQPNTGWVFSNVPTIAMVDREPRQLPTTILGRAVLIRANPGAMTWTWGDGTSTITYDRGSPYPNPSLTHTYAYFEGDVVITLTSTWSGEYSLDGGATWRPAPGTARTESTPVPLTVHNPHSHVVACDTNGSCRS